MIDPNVDPKRKPPIENAPAHEGDAEACLHVPELARLSYFHGQLLSAADLRTEQSYFREKLKLHNRCLHGHGVVCGLEVSAAEICDDKHPGPHVRVKPGIALDCHGNELILRRAVTLSLWSLLDSAEVEALREGRATVSLSICFCEQPSCRAQSVLPEACGSAPVPSHARVRDSIRFEAHVDAADEAPREEACDGCCDAGCGCSGCEGCGCVLLARIGPLRPVQVEPGKSAPSTQQDGAPLEPGAVDSGVRRMLARYLPTRVDGISWQHGARYSPAEAKQILGTENESGGLEIQFTRPVQAATLREGVLDVWVIEGGRGRSAGIWHLEGSYAGLPATGFVKKVRYRHTGGEALQSGDRVLLVLRGAFVLDRCCRPVAGTHIGGKVPLLPAYAGRAHGCPGEPDGCSHPPGYPGPWTTGGELGGTTFESWFFVG